MTLTVETWIEALESGKYEQTTGVLRGSGGYCCLGVACHLSEIGEWSESSGAYFNDEDAWSCHVELPFPVQELLGLNTEDGDFNYASLPTNVTSALRPYLGEEPEPTISLAELNDNHVPFPLIAKVIRARPKGLFREEERS